MRIVQKYNTRDLYDERCSSCSPVKNRERLIIGQLSRFTTVIEIETQDHNVANNINITLEDK